MDQVKLIIENYVEVSEEYSTESIMVGSIWDLLDANEAGFSVTAKTVKIPPRFYFDGCVLQRKFDWLQCVVKFVARLASYQNMPIIFNMRVNRSFVLFHLF